ncbi:G-type lectin S-receptor-like serine/threonine-protein kinase LECRK3 [Apium graveolens]|uniref:G-type lectin S-receptor-like serine/threonine-protein kinase LECRK3 n=1 Tax=Apium graveolens TaxID=4045 RepID=UPI003D78FC41
MASSLFSLLVLLSAVSFVTAQQNVTNIISQGSSLKPTGKSHWLSPSGLFAFGFYPLGENNFSVGVFLAGLPLNKTVVWTANRDSPYASKTATLRLTLKGELILREQYSNTLIVKLDQHISSASMQDNGNFVLYDSNQEMIWQSFTHPTDSMLPGQFIGENQELISSRSESDYSPGKFRLKMQVDSDLVQYPVGVPDSPQTAYWATGTWNTFHKNVTLNLDTDGYLYLLQNSVDVIYPITEGFLEKERLYLFKIDPDGILRLYSLSLDGKGNSSSVVWQSSENKCVPRGICGPNSYCTLNNDDEATCQCPLGFKYVNPANTNDGCVRNYTAASCNNTDHTVQYNMTQLQHVQWPTVPDSDEMITKEECEAACLKDCKCDAALFHGNCSRLSFPLEYGSYALSDDNTIAYIKYAWPTPANMTRDNKDQPVNPVLSPVIQDPVLTPDKARNNKDQSVIPVLTAGIAGGLALMLVFLLLSHWGVRRHQQVKNKKLKENYFQQNGGILLQQLLYKSESTVEKAKIYTEEELRKATNDFDESNVIGQGGYGVVYKGVVDDAVIAIKKSKLVDRNQIDHFINEVAILSQINHPNVVKLLGCCLETPVPLLVYEFVTNNTLFDHIHGEGSYSSISWDLRLKIATETAGALAHMHSAPVHIIHRDVKSANVLLDDEYTAKVSDFGVSRLLSPEESHLSTLVQGTLGYIDPEYFHSGNLTHKSDVYSFGALLVELLTGAKVYSFYREMKDRNIGMYFLCALEDDRLHEILEPRVREEGHAEQLRGVAALSKKCLNIKGENRPTMAEVKEELAELRMLYIEYNSSFDQM